jgi:hypothetical protein
MNSIKFIFALILITFLINSCDYVQPYTPKGKGNVDTSSSITSIISDSTTMRNVLVEDYTGHTCGNCPGAAIILDSIINDNPGRIVPMAVHAGTTFAAPVAGFTTDFETSTGTAWDTYFDISSGFGNPCGMVDRFGPTVSVKPQYDGSWKDSVTADLLQSNIVNIKITNTYRDSARTLSTTVTSTFLQASSNNYLLNVVVTEDSVIDVQKDYALGTHDTVPNYVFNHVLRASFNGTWGDTLAKAPVINTSYTKSYTLALGTSENSSGIKNILVDKHCHVVAFIYDAITLNVVQACEAWVTH